MRKPVLLAIAAKTSTMILLSKKLHNPPPPVIVVFAEPKTMYTLHCVTFDTGYCCWLVGWLVVSAQSLGCLLFSLASKWYLTEFMSMYLSWLAFLSICCPLFYSSKVFLWRPWMNFIELWISVILVLMLLMVVISCTSCWFFSTYEYSYINYRIVCASVTVLIICLYQVYVESGGNKNVRMMTVSGESALDSGWVLGMAHISWLLYCVGCLHTASCRESRLDLHVKRQLFLLLPYAVLVQRTSSSIASMYTVVFNTKW